MKSDPYAILDVSPSDDDATIKQSYLVRIRQCPPERDSQAFQALREAYEAIATERDRARHRLLGAPCVDLPRRLARHLPKGQPRRPDAEQLRGALAASLRRQPR